MLRPLIESIYDYRMATETTSTSASNSYRHHYLEACALTASA